MPKFEDHARELVLKSFADIRNDMSQQPFADTLEALNFYPAVGNERYTEWLKNMVCTDERNQVTNVDVSTGGNKSDKGFQIKIV